MMRIIGGLFSQSVGIDLGTATIQVYVKGRGIVISEPSVVALSAEDKKVLAVGSEAKKMLGKTPKDIITVRPMMDGVISDFEITEKMIRYFIARVHHRKSFVHPRIIICVPSGVTEVEKKSVMDVTLEAGARESYLIEEPIAAAIGAGLPIYEPAGNMVVDIGGGTTEIAVISLGGIVVGNSIKVAGDEMNNAILQYMKNKYKLAIGEQMSELIKISIGDALEGNTEKNMDVRGRDMVTGLPRVINVTSAELYEPLSGPINRIIDAIKSTLERVPPELTSDIIDRGITLTGGGALLPNLDTLITREVGVPTYVADESQFCVIKGIGMVLEELQKLKRVLSSPVK